MSCSWFTFDGKSLRRFNEQIIQYNFAIDKAVAASVVYAKGGDERVQDAFTGLGYLLEFGGPKAKLFCVIFGNQVLVCAEFDFAKIDCTVRSINNQVNLGVCVFETAYACKHSLNAELILYLVGMG